MDMKSIKSMIKVVSPAALIAVMFLGWALPAPAAVVFLLDKSDYIANHPGQLVQNFDSGKVDPGTFEICNEPVNQFNDDDCFDPGDILPGLTFATNPIGANVIFLAGINFQGAANPNNALARGSGPGTFDVFFQGGVNSAGLDIGCFAEGAPCNTLQTVRLFDVNDDLIDAIQVKTDDFFSTFVGFNSTIPVARVNISGPEDFSQGVDEVRFGMILSNIPTLSEWGMIAAAAGLVMIGVFFAIRRRKAQAV